MRPRSPFLSPALLARRAGERKRVVLPAAESHARDLTDEYISTERLLLPLAEDGRRGGQALCAVGGPRLGVQGDYRLRLWCPRRVFLAGFLCLCFGGQPVTVMGVVCLTRVPFWLVMVVGIVRGFTPHSLVPRVRARTELGCSGRVVWKLVMGASGTAGKVLEVMLVLALICVSPARTIVTP